MNWEQRLKAEQPALYKQLSSGKLWQVCPECKRNEAAGPWCSRCGYRTNPDDWFPNGDLSKELVARGAETAATRRLETRPPHPNRRGRPRKGKGRVTSDLASQLVLAHIGSGRDNARSCSIEGCGRPLRARGLCATHWSRWQRHGDPGGPGLLRDRRAFWDRVEKTDSCWIWHGCLDKGYGQHMHGGKAQGAHRWAWEWANGPIPPGLHIDHLCRNTRCVNPDHLEPVTPGENTRRNPRSPSSINREKTHCIRGHRLPTEPNKAGYRVCQPCAQAYHRDRQRLRRNPERRPIIAQVRRVKAETNFREALVLEAAGLGRKEIAARFGVRPKTVTAWHRVYGP